MHIYHKICITIYIELYFVVFDTHVTLFVKTMSQYFKKNECPVYRRPSLNNMIVIIMYVPITKLDQ